MRVAAREGASRLEGGGITDVPSLQCPVALSAKPRRRNEPQRRTPQKLARGPVLPKGAGKAQAFTVALERNDPQSARPPLSGGQADHVLVTQANAAGLDFDKPGERAHERALAIPFDSRHADDLSRCDGEADLAERRTLRIQPSGNAIGNQNGWRGGHGRDHGPRFGRKFRADQRFLILTVRVFSASAPDDRGGKLTRIHRVRRDWPSTNRPPRSTATVSAAARPPGSCEERAKW